MFSATKTKKDIEDAGGRVIAVVGDNHSAVQRALDEVIAQDAGCVKVRCFAHSLQVLRLILFNLFLKLLVKHISHLTPIKEGDEIIDSFIERLRNPDTSTALHALRVW